MFTGIITEVGAVESTTSSSISIRAPRSARRARSGGSIAVDGACLTVSRKRGGVIEADVMPETARRTTFGELQRGTRVNLELPATPASFLGGHIVQGHVDGTGVVADVQKRGNSRLLTIAIPAELSRLLVPQGSVAINGVSLTVIDSGRRSFTVGIVPHTWSATALNGLRAGERVNIETDVLAKYVLKRAHRARRT